MRSYAVKSQSYALLKIRDKDEIASLETAAPCLQGFRCHSSIVYYNGASTYAEVAGAPGDPSNNYEVFMTDYAVQGADRTAVGDVPEPTSGLLPLLGVAGLALKRKNA